MAIRDFAEIWNSKIYNRRFALVAPTFLFYSVLGPFRRSPWFNLDNINDSQILIREATERKFRILYNLAGVYYQIHARKGREESQGGGVPIFGRTFLLSNPTDTHVLFGKTIVTAGNKGPYTNEDGFMGYNEICLELKNHGSSWQKHWHDQTATPYLRNGNEAISYDNERSIAKKVKLAIDYNLGGVMAWSIDTDDYYGLCDREDDAFIDFEERYHKMINDPVLNEALRTIDLEDSSSEKAYTISTDRRLILRLPEAHNNYRPLIKLINEVITLALEEKRITDEMKKVTRRNEKDS